MRKAIFSDNKPERDITPKNWDCTNVPNELKGMFKQYGVTVQATHLHTLMEDFSSDIYPVEYWEVVVICNGRVTQFKYREPLFHSNPSISVYDLIDKWRDHYTPYFFLCEYSDETRGW